MLRCETNGRRAHRLAVVAAVDPVAEHGPPSPVDDPRLLDDPGQATTGIDHARGDDRAGRAGVDAAAARAAAIGHRLVGGRQRGRGDHAAEHEPTAGTRQEEVGVLAEPADTGAVGNLAIDDRVVVGEHDRPPSVAPQSTGDSPKAFAQRLIVIGPGVASDAPVWPFRRRRFIGVVRACADQDRAGIGDRSPRIRRADRVLVRELQTVVQAGVLPTDQLGPGSLEDLGVADPEVGDAVQFGDVDQLLHVRAVNRRR